MENNTNKNRTKSLKKVIAAVAGAVVVVAILMIVVLGRPASNSTAETGYDNSLENAGNTSADATGYANSTTDEGDTSTPEDGVVLSVAPGFHDEAFDLIVSVPSIPNVVIYYTIDGNDPQPGDDRFVERRGNSIQVSGRLPENGLIRVEDRTANWRDTILTSHHADRFRGSTARSRIRPASRAEILQGTAFRFQGFVDGEPVTEIITATYIIAPDAGKRFAHLPVVAITAPYDDFVYIYEHTSRYDPIRYYDPIVRRRVFTYEYFEYGESGYELIFNLPASTSLGGNFTRDSAQRTLNAHFSRGELDGVITHPIFPDVDELERFRLRNGGNGFMIDHMRDPFAQTASSGLNVLYSRHQLAIKFINGEFWGFTQIREHTSNRHFVSTHTGLARRNIAIMDHDAYVNTEEQRIRIMAVSEGPEDVVRGLYNELMAFVTSHDMSTDYARERLFNEFVCQENFIDYMIANTFFHNSDWPHNNVRIFRAITPDPDSENPYEDGKWRFMLNDMDLAPSPNRGTYNSNRFPFFLSIHSSLEALPAIAEFAHVFLVFNNLAFVEEFRERALYVLDTEFQTDRLLALHDEFVAEHVPLLPEMYNRFAVQGTVEDSIANFERRRAHLATFLANREPYYRQHLDALVDRLS